MDDRLTALIAVFESRKPVAVRFACRGTGFGGHALRDADKVFEDAGTEIPVDGICLGVCKTVETDDLLEASLVLPAIDRLLDGGYRDILSLCVDVDTVPRSAGRRAVAAAGHVTFAQAARRTGTAQGGITVYARTVRGRS